MADKDIGRRHEIIVSILSLSPITYFELLIAMPERGRLDEKTAAALAGLAPVSKQSEPWIGRASIAGGRAIVRQALYMPALVAARFNPDLSAKYQSLIKAGKPPKIAFTAIMRKLLILANALLRKNAKPTKNQLDKIRGKFFPKHSLLITERPFLSRCLPKRGCLVHHQKGGRGETLVPGALFHTITKSSMAKIMQ